MDKQTLDALFSEKFLSKESYQTLLAALRPADEKAWLSVRLLTAGTAFVLSGIICFFAANWQEMGIILRLSVPLVALVLCGAGAFYKKLNTVSGQAFAFGTAVFIGIFLAVFGQEYQTGAFLYELFGLWALLLLPLCVLTRNKWMYLFTLYVATLYWASRQGSILNLSFWSVASGVYFALWALCEFLPACQKWGEGFKRFLWIPLSVYVTVYGCFSAEKLFYYPKALYFFAALVLAACGLSYAQRKEDVALFGWNLLAGVGLLCAYLVQWLEFELGSIFVYCVLFAAASWKTYAFWFDVKGKNK